MNTALHRRGSVTPMSRHMIIYAILSVVLTLGLWGGESVAQERTRSNQTCEWQPRDLVRYVSAVRTYISHHTSSGREQFEAYLNEQFSSEKMVRMNCFNGRHNPDFRYVARRAHKFVEHFLTSLVQIDADLEEGLRAFSRQIRRFPHLIRLGRSGFLEALKSDTWQDVPNIKAISDALRTAETPDASAFRMALAQLGRFRDTQSAAGGVYYAINASFLGQRVTPSDRTTPLAERVDLAGVNEWLNEALPAVLLTFGYHDLAQSLWNFTGEAGRHNAGPDIAGELRNLQAAAQVFVGRLTTFVELLQASDREIPIGDLVEHLKTDSITTAVTAILARHYPQIEAGWAILSALRGRSAGQIAVYAPLAGVGSSSSIQDDPDQGALILRVVREVLAGLGYSETLVALDKAVADEPALLAAVSEPIPDDDPWFVVTEWPFSERWANAARAFEEVQKAESSTGALVFQHLDRMKLGAEFIDAWGPFFETLGLYDAVTKQYRGVTTPVNIERAWTYLRDNHERMAPAFANIAGYGIGEVSKEINHQFFVPISGFFTEEINANRMLLRQTSDYLIFFGNALSLKPIAAGIISRSPRAIEAAFSLPANIVRSAKELARLTKSSASVAENVIARLPANTLGMWRALRVLLTARTDATARQIGLSWNADIMKRGISWEIYIATNRRFTYRMPLGFRTFDFFDDITGHAISAKTMNTLTRSAKSNPKQLFYRLKKYVDEIVRFPGHRKLGVVISRQMVKSRSMELAIPSNTPMRALEHIYLAVEYAREHGVVISIHLL